MTKQSIILGIGTGRCGTASLAKILNQQPDMVCSFDEPPLLPWKTGSRPSPPAPLPKGEWRFEDGPLAQAGEGNIARVGNAPSPPAPLPKGEGRFEDSPLPKGEGRFLDDTVQQAGEGSAARIIRERFARFRLHGKAPLLGDCASFYLPYIEEAIAAEPDIRIVCLRRPREEVVGSFCQWLDQTMPLPTNHWAQQPAPEGLKGSGVFNLDKDGER